MNENEINLNHYDEKSIEVLEGLEAVRKRPGMYIGGTGSRALHHMVFEIVDNSVDEALAGYCDSITLTIEKDNSIIVEDNGRGIPVGLNEKLKKSTLEVVLTVLHAGGKFGGKGYKFSGGLHGVGLSVVNALSSWLHAKVKRDGYEWSLKLQRGTVVSPLKQGRKTKETGTIIHFLPDPEIFDTTIFQYEILAQRLKEIAFLNKGIKLSIIDNRETEPIKETFKFTGGLTEFVKEINQDKKTLHKQIGYVSGSKDGLDFELAFQYTDEYSDTIISFVNNIHTVDGGTHEVGFKSALSRAINDIARKKKILKEKESNLSGDDLREGLTAVLSLRMLDPQFEGQVKSKLSNANVKGILESVLYEKLSEYFSEHASILSSIVNKAKEAMKARELAKKSRDISTKKNNAEIVGLSSKFAKCISKNPEECELYLVEGDSAGGSAKQGRDRYFQSILPLKGKIMNTEKAKLTSILSNDEIKTIIAAIGAGIGKEFDISNANYHKVIIMTDADIDGKHIVTLLLTFFYRFMRPLIEEGYLYIACPPLYEITKGKEVYYAYSDKQRDQILKIVGKNADVQRYKGLGEMDPEQLWETTMNPQTRKLIKVRIDDAIIADQTFSTLMGNDVDKRKDFIQRNAKNANINI